MQDEKENAPEQNVLILQNGLLGRTAAKTLPAKTQLEWTIVDL